MFELEFQRDVKVVLVVVVEIFEQPFDVELHNNLNKIHENNLKKFLEKEPCSS